VGWDYCCLASDRSRSSSLVKRDSLKKKTRINVPRVFITAIKKPEYAACVSGGFAMDRVKIRLQNCYGIAALDQEFDFSQKRAVAIYAPNGAMKSSLAQTFQDIASGTPSVDRIFTNRVALREITDETGAELTPGQVLVVNPYSEEYGDQKKTSTLLLDPILKRELDALYADIEAAKDALIASIKAQAKTKKDLEEEISLAVMSEGGEFELALGRLKPELEKQKDAPFADVPYDKIFDEKVVGALDNKDLKDVIEEYVTRYNELLAASTFFRKGIFDHYNAGQIAKSLADNGFFNAEHTVTLNAAGEKREIKTKKDLEKVISDEKDQIFKDKKLVEQFDKIAKQLEANAPLREFRSYVLDHAVVLGQLNNIAKFKQTLFKSYLKIHEAAYFDLLKKYAGAEKRREEIKAEAKKQVTQWESVITMFNDRFHVPFTVAAKNKIDLVTGTDSIIDLEFTYHSRGEDVAITRDKLIKWLSNGEKKAYYILQVLFEVETRIKEKRETLIVVDDLADSFDYQNKYAIIQYLKEIAEGGLFKQIIMTHNFDFFRTLESRCIHRTQCFMAVKSEEKISLEPAVGIRNIFQKDWKVNFFKDDKKKIATIPFLRNLVEYTRDDEENFLRLTSLLHWKTDSAKISVADLDAIFKSICGQDGTSKNGAQPVFDLITACAGECLKAPDGMNFENKIVLSIAIRLTADRFMVGKIKDDAFWKSLDSHQTPDLLARFKKDFSGDVETIAALDEVVLMTPENIHLNSFMYEPLIDMSDEHLRKLYAKVVGL
jgi:hypothetical protein